MITLFENETHDLTDEEKNALPLMIKGLKSHRGKANAITSAKMIEGMEIRGHKMNGARVRKMINYIRCKRLITNLIGSSSGYYVATHQKEIEDYKKSLDERIAAIQAVRDSFN